MLKIVIGREAARALSRIPTNVGDLVEDKIEQLARDSDSLRNNVTRLVGTKESRLRVGDWRVISRIDGEMLRIIRIAARGSVYE